MIINGIQSATYDREHIMETTFDTPTILLWVGFTACMFLFATFVSLLLQIVGAVFFNLSLLTSDFYGVLYYWLRTAGWQPSGLYFAAFSLTVTGCALYTILGDVEERQQTSRQLLEPLADSSEG